MLCPSIAVSTENNLNSHQSPHTNEKYQIPDNLEVYLEVTLNGVERGLHLFELHNDQLWASIATLDEIGLKLPSTTEPKINVATLEKVKVSYQAEQQQLVLNVDENAAQLPRNIFTNVDTKTYPGSSANGVLLNYETFATHSESSNAASLFTEFRAFNSLATLSNTALTYLNDSAQTGYESIRLDTSLSTSWQDSMITLQAGDAITDNLSWSRGT